MILRQAHLSDLDSIMHIEASSFIPSIQEDREVFKQRILRCPELFLVFEKRGQTFNEVAGYLCAEVMNKIPQSAQELQLGHLPADMTKIDESWDKGDRPLIYISSFALLPEYRGDGNGRKMWQASMKYFRERFTPQSLLLLVNEVWEGAKHIYSDSGFEVVRVFENFFPSMDKGFSNGILMQNLIK